LDGRHVKAVSAEPCRHSFQIGRFLVEEPSGTDYLYQLICFCVYHKFRRKPVAEARNGFFYVAPGAVLRQYSADHYLVWRIARPPMRVTVTGI
jgi:hypothetical protein